VRRLGRGGFAVCLIAGLNSVGTPAGPAVRTPHNPILSDERYFSADPAPFVVGDTLFILAGRNEAPPRVNDFVMNGWQLLTTTDVA
jgi:hypothetical protein